MSNVGVTHIAHVVYSFKTGGLENGVVNLINHLPADKYHHSIICLTEHDAEFIKRIKQSNVEFYDLNKPAGKGLGWLVNCWKLLRKLKPDICHSRNLNPLEAQIAAFCAGIKVRIHGEHGWDTSDIGGTNVKYQRLRKCFKPLISHYIALSSEAELYLKKTIGVNNNKVTRICNGVDVDKFTPTETSLELNSRFTQQDALVFGTVGRLAEVKNQTFLVEAFLALYKQFPQHQEQLSLIIVGDGVLMPALKELVDEAGAEQAVWFAGLQSDIPAFLNALDIFVLPSLAEGISNTILEAMASGVPVIATKVGGNGDLIMPEYQQSHLVQVNNIDQLVNAMARYLTEPEKITKEAEQVRQYCVEQFSIQAMVDKYHHLYQHMISKE